MNDFFVCLFVVVVWIFLVLVLYTPGCQRTLNTNSQSDCQQARDLALDNVATHLFSYLFIWCNTSLSLVQRKALELLPVTGPNTKQALWRRRKKLGEATVDKTWARMDSLPSLVKHRSRRWKNPRQINTRALLVKPFIEHLSRDRHFRSPQYIAVW